MNLVRFPLKLSLRITTLIWWIDTFSVEVVETLRVRNTIKISNEMWMLKYWIYGKIYSNGIEDTRYTLHLSNNSEFSSEYHKTMCLKLFHSDMQLFWMHFCGSVESIFEWIETFSVWIGRVCIVKYSNITSYIIFTLKWHFRCHAHLSMHAVYWFFALSPALCTMARRGVVWAYMRCRWMQLIYLNSMNQNEID